MFCVLLGASSAVVAGMASATSATIVSRGPATSVLAADDNGTTAFRLQVPSGTRVGDVLLASVAFGRYGGTTLTAPAGWTQASRTSSGSSASLVIFTHVFAAGEASYTWRTGAAAFGVGFLAAFGGVDTTRPVDGAAGREDSDGGKSIATPSITTTSANDVLVASYAGVTSRSSSPRWSPPNGMTELGERDSDYFSGTLDFAGQTAAGASGTKTASIKPSQDVAIATLTALRPATPPPPPTTTTTLPTTTTTLPTTTTTQPTTTTTRPTTTTTLPTTTTTTPPAPVISGVGAGAVTAQGATIFWTTNLASDSQVEYGTTTSYDSATAVDATPVT
ncbi:MAG: hypothetical protein M3066_14905, partial [Actinomycetota bacterium]|nr:hypothetical protein [Actinomycetota bacterium]